MQHVVRSTCTMGAPYQWSSDITEHCHITHVKRPYRMTNHKDFHALHSSEVTPGKFNIRNVQGSKRNGSPLSRSDLDLHCSA
ncbi:hypothetical protein DFJ58DRAFT_834057 [Suillus subalutaceus]|uniref:uncharacterized protein n=1 Tax=Suillus subalutaceus TaxID=48586 RepID=UPI001B86B440|nr:uncharacterized protein DFJ58DRAFT_834057 [Suillus subalutaceus]KAG1816299.1 hypothetical protein DFJ58DRAFT_834057 [Suillus subalutaceus]